jgi:hypothetical protein
LDSPKTPSAQDFERLNRLRKETIDEGTGFSPYIKEAKNNGLLEAALGPRCAEKAFPQGLKAQ